MSDFLHWMSCLWKAGFNLDEAHRGYQYERITGWSYW